MHLHTYFFTGEDMTDDEIINLAIENTIHGLKFDEEGLLRFAKLVAQHEREACAKFIEHDYVRQFERPWRDDLSDAIRAMGKA